MKIHFNDGWYFTTEYTDHLPHSTLQDLDSLIPVRLPHTVKELPFNYLDEKSYQMVSGYLHPLTAPEDWQGKAVLLTFGAAAHEATVFCNGTPLCTHRNGYNAFTVDLSDHLHYGAENMIAVRLDSRETLDQPPFGHVIGEGAQPADGCLYPCRLLRRCLHSSFRHQHRRLRPFWPDPCPRRNCPD